MDTRKTRVELALLSLVIVAGCFQPKLSRKFYGILWLCGFLAPFRSPAAVSEVRSVSTERSKADPV